jgi:hypothetical protein
MLLRGVCTPTIKGAEDCNAKYSLALAEFAGLFAGGADGGDEGGAEAGAFEFVEAFDGGAARAGDLVFEGAGMEAGFEDHLRAAEHGLRGELGGDVAGEARGDTAVAEGFDD